MQNNIIYQIHNLVKNYNNKTILNIPFLEINNHDILCLLGATGTGKTTFLKILANIIKPDQGSIKFLNIEHSHPLYEKNIKEHVVMVFQNPIMISGTVWSNIELGLKVKNKPISKKKIFEILEQLQITHIIRYNAKLLSEGEKQKVALARALITEPKILLLDEPTSHLDPKNSQLILQVIKNYQLQKKTLIIICTHDIYFSLKLTNNIKTIQNTNIVVAPIEI